MIYLSKSSNQIYYMSINMKELACVLLAVVTLGITFNYFYKNKDLTTIKSTVDGREYTVRKLSDKLDAANKLAHISQNLTRLVEHTYSNDKSRYGVIQLKENFNSRNITENTPGGTYTAYSVNKGEQLVFCLRLKKEGDRLVPKNTILFVECFHCRISLLLNVNLF